MSAEENKEKEQEMATGNAPKESGAKPEGEGKTPTLPAPTLSTLVHMLFVQGMIAAGKAISPVSNKYETDLNLAKYHVEMLELLQEKTKGNRTDEENEAMDEMLHQLRLAYVDASRPR